jgi:hypothetical protein
MIPAHRKKLNDIVQSMNDKLKKIVAEFKDERIQFVDYSGFFGDVDGRFCTHGRSVGEDKRLGELTLYPLNLGDSFGTEPMKRDDSTQGYVTNGTFEGDINYMATIAAFMDIPYKDHVKRMPKDSIETAVDWIKDEVDQINVLPDGFGRVFHPTMLGHQIVANNILWHLEARDAKVVFQEQLPERGDWKDICPLIPPSECAADDDTSKLPSKLFWQYNFSTYSGKGIFDGFCESMDSGKTDRQTNQEWKVNAQGATLNILQKVISGDTTASIHQRSPPVDPQLFGQDITLKWIPGKDSRDCTMKCSNAYEEMWRGNCGGKGDKKDEMSKRASQDIHCGTFSYEISDKKQIVEAEPTQCLKGKWGAPRGEQEIKKAGVGGTSVDSAYNQWCQEIDGKEVKDQLVLDTLYDRWGFSDLNVPDRHSFWLRAKYAKREGCQGTGTAKADICKEAIQKAMETCAPSSGFTQGFIAKPEGCVDYSVEISGSVHEGSPPWDDHVVNFPPSEDTEAQSGGTNIPSCSSIAGIKHRVAKVADLEKAIDEYCSNGSEFEMENSNEDWRTHNAGISIALASSTFKKSSGPGSNSKRPVKDMRWCE